jgi:hypothetical protein
MGWGKALQGVGDLGLWVVYAYGLLLVAVFVGAFVVRLRERSRRRRPN